MTPAPRRGSTLATLAELAVVLAVILGAFAVWRTWPRDAAAGDPLDRRGVALVRGLAALPPEIWPPSGAPGLPETFALEDHVPGADTAGLVVVSVHRGSEVVATTGGAPVSATYAGDAPRLLEGVEIRDCRLAGGILARLFTGHLADGRRILAVFRRD